MKFVHTFIFLIFAISVNHGFRLLEKSVKPVGPINEKCMKMENCEFFKCFEKRFPCGKDYWMMKVKNKKKKLSNYKLIIKFFVK